MQSWRGLPVCIRVCVYIYTYMYTYDPASVENWEGYKVSGVFTIRHLWNYRLQGVSFILLENFSLEWNISLESLCTWILMHDKPLRYLVASQSLSWSDYLTRNRRVWETYTFLCNFSLRQRFFRGKESC